jgi:hypothetical protein
MSRLPHFLDNGLTDGGEAVSLMRRSPFNPRKIPGTHFCQRLSRPQGQSAARRIWSIEKSTDLIGNRTRDLPACSIVPQPTTLPSTPADGGTATNILNLIPCEWSDSWSGHFPVRGDPPPILNWTRGRVGPRAGLMVVKRKISAPTRDKTPDRHSRSSLL